MTAVSGTVVATGGLHADVGPRSEPTTVQANVDSGQRILALDGVRGLAFCLVFAFHFALSVGPRSAFDIAILDVFHSGWTGVDLFFVLSGFLITGILLDSRESPHYFRNFYVRRTLRIFPLYYATLALILVVLPRVAPHVRSMDMFQRLHENQAWFWTYLTNVRVAMTRSWDTVAAGRLNHFWSLAVEEQFYLLWPALVLVTGTRRLVWLCGSIVVGALFVRAGLLMVDHGPVPGYGYVPHIAGYVLLPARADALAIGAAVAALARTPGGYGWMRRVATPLMALTGVVVVVLSRDGGMSQYAPIVQLAGYPLTSLFFASVLVIALDPRGGVIRRGLEWSPLRRVGTYAYGMYIFHYPIRYALVTAGLVPEQLFPGLPTALPGFLVVSAAGFGVTLLVAAVSWHCFEAPVLGLRRWFPREGRGTMGAQVQAAP